MDIKTRNNPAIIKLTDKLLQLFPDGQINITQDKWVALDDMLRKVYLKFGYTQMETFLTELGFVVNIKPKKRIADVVIDKSISNANNSNIQNKRGTTPEQRLENALKKLEQYYPEHKIYAFNSLDKELQDRITKLSQMLGYETYKALLEEYDFQVITNEEGKILRDGVHYEPGSEPDVIKSKVDSIVSRLEHYYPDRLIVRNVENDHRSLGNDIRGIVTWLGYKDIESFMAAYGFEYHNGGGGRPVTTNPDEIVEELKRRSNGSAYSSLNELREQNPDLAGQLKTIANNAHQLFGKSFANYLKEIGLVQSKTKKSAAELSHESACEQLVKRNEGDETVLEQVKGLVLKWTASSNTIAVHNYDAGYDATTINLPEGINKISNNVFIGFKSLEEITIPSSLMNIGNGAFMNCTNLNSVTIKNTDCKIGKDAFKGCPCEGVVMSIMNKRKGSGKSKNILAVTDYLRSEVANKLEECIISEPLLINTNADEIRGYMNELFDHFAKVGYLPESLWVDNKLRLGFFLGETYYQTDMKPIGDDYRIVDCIIKKAFEMDKVMGNVEYLSDERYNKNKPFNVINIEDVTA